MHPGAVLASLASLAAAAGVWCWSQYLMHGYEITMRQNSAESKAILKQQTEAHTAAVKKLEQENTGLRQQLAEALEAAKPPPTPQEVAQRVVTQRMLAFLRMPQWVPAAAEEITKRLAAKATAGLTPPVAEARMRACLAMGFVKDPFDYANALKELAAMKPGGVYDPETNKFYYQAEASLARADSRSVFAGAILPVLLGQNFGNSAPPLQPDNDDAALAAQALMFGDASFSRVRFTISDQLNANYDKGQAPAAPLSSPVAPQYLVDMWKWSEDAGNLFVQVLHGKGEFAAVDQAYQRPPRSSAEILHPDKLYLADPPFVPVGVSFPDTSVNGAAPLLSNVAGEIGSFFLLRNFADVDYAATATEGWVGDRFLVWAGSREHGDHVLWRTVWSSDEDAKQFFDAMRRIVMQRYLIPWQKEFDAVPGEFRVDEPHRIIRLQSKEGTVTLLNATDPVFAKAAEEKFRQDR